MEMRKTIKMLLILVLFIGIVTGSPKAINASSNIKVLLEGQELKFDVPPQIVEGRTLLPLRAIFEALGLEVEWDNETKTISGTAEGKEIILKLDSKDAKVNGVNKTLDVPAKAINGRTLVPVRFIAESLDMNVDWNQDTRTVKINKNGDIVIFKDPNFEKVVRNTIKKHSGEILKKDIEHIKEISVLNYMVDSLNSLEGIEHFKSLEKLTIVKNSDIWDLNPLKNLNNLKTIEFMMESKISNLEPLKDLTKLERLVINDGIITDISHLKGLVNLRELYLSNNNIKDIGGLSSLAKLEELSLYGNDIINIESISNMNNLKKLFIGGNKVSNLSPIANLPKLEYLDITNIPITITELAKVYQPLSKKGVHILTSYTENELLSIKIHEEKNIATAKGFIEDVFHIDELFKRLPISDYVKIFDNNGVYHKEYDSFRLNKTDHYEDGNISYKNSYGKNQLIAYFDLGKQTNTEFDNLKDAFKIKYGRPFTEDVEEDDYRNAKITRWNGIELRRYSDSVRGETTQLWIFVQEESDNNELAGNKELSISEIKAYLTSNYGTLDTNIGTTKFTFKIYENESSNIAYDYWIQVEYDYNYFEGAMNSNKYSSEQKNRLRQELKEHQRKLAEALIELLPNKKLYGGYYDSWYRYPNLRVDLITRRYYSWTNYDEPEWGLDISDYEQTKPSYFRWYDLIDDKL